LCVQSPWHCAATPVARALLTCAGLGLAWAAAVVAATLLRGAGVFSPEVLVAVGIVFSRRAVRGALRVTALRVAWVWGAGLAAGLTMVPVMTALNLDRVT